MLKTGSRSKNNAMRRARRLVACLLAAVGPALLVGCDSVEIRPGSGASLMEVRYRVPPEEVRALEAAPVCCASLADLPYRPLDREGPITLDLAAGSPAYTFDTGKSFFAAFALPPGPRPLEVSVTSRLHALTPAIAANRPIFNPAVAILDERHRVRQFLHEPGSFAVMPVPGATAGIEVRGTFHIDATREDAAYLVVLTTDALRARSAERSGARIDGFSAVGIVDLAVRSAPFLVPPVTFRSDAARMTPDTQVTLFPDHKLFVDRTGVHFVAVRDSHYTERAVVPFAQIVAVRYESRLVGGAALVLDTARSPDARGIASRSRSFPSARSDPAICSWRSRRSLRAFARLVSQGLAVEAGDRVPEVVFRDPPRGASTAGQRIAEGAMTGGMLTAGVCGLCAGGVCPPEVLLSCAGLFAVGAAVGGLVGIGTEPAAGAGASAPPPVPMLSAPQVAAAKPAVRTRVDDVIAQAAVRECVVRRLSGEAFWVAQGRAATLVSQPGGARFILRTSVDRVVLAGEGEPGQAAEAMPVRLVVEGGVVMRDTASGRKERRPVVWRGAAHSLGDWSARDGVVLEAALKEACDGFAGAALGTAAPLWRAAP